MSPERSLNTPTLPRGNETPPLQAACSYLACQYSNAYWRDWITWKTPDSLGEYHRKPTYKWSNVPDPRQENTVGNTPHRTSSLGSLGTWDTSLKLLENLEGSLSLPSPLWNTCGRRDDTSASGHQLLQGCVVILQGSYTQEWLIFDSLVLADLWNKKENTKSKKYKKYVCMYVKLYLDTGNHQ